MSKRIVEDEQNQDTKISKFTPAHYIFASCTMAHPKTDGFFILDLIRLQKCFLALAPDAKTKYYTSSAYRLPGGRYRTSLNEDVNEEIRPVLGDTCADELVDTTSTFLDSSTLLFDLKTTEFNKGDYVFIYISDHSNDTRVYDAKKFWTSKEWLDALQMILNQELVPRCASSFLGSLEENLITLHKSYLDDSFDAVIGTNETDSIWSYLGGGTYTSHITSSKEIIYDCIKISSASKEMSEIERMEHSWSSHLRRLMEKVYLRPLTTNDLQPKLKIPDDYLRSILQLLIDESLINMSLFPGHHAVALLYRKNVHIESLRTLIRSVKSEMTPHQLLVDY